MDEDVIFEVGQPESDVHIDFEGCAEVSLPEPISETIALVVDDMDAESPAEEFFVPGAPHVKKPEKKEDKEKADELIDKGYAKLFMYPDKMVRRFKTN